MKETKSSRRLPALFRWIGWVLLFQLVLINISAAIYAHRLTHFYNDPSLQGSHTSDNIFRKTWKLFTGPKFPKSVIRQTPSFSYDTVRLMRSNGNWVDAWYGEPDSLARGTVIMFHGLSASKSYMVREAATFRLMGYRVMLVDLRAHGNSEGQNTSIGRKETEEVQLAYNYIQSKGEKSIFLWGVSMGAVVVARSVAVGAVQPAGIIMELPFESLQSHLKARARVLGFPQQPFAFLVTGWIGIESGFNGYGHSTVNYAKKINCPVLLQYGAKDTYVLKSEIDGIYKAIPGNHKNLVGYEEAGHESLLMVDPERWKETTGSFLLQNQRQG
ncbi:MAG TPA: alpha/beta fold hydrolase [Chitinophagaceae bacterium]|nr:alpha/beta fold hydrolase [Chitinophagaceae bacterium]